MKRPASQYRPRKQHKARPAREDIYRVTLSYTFDIRSFGPESAADFARLQLGTVLTGYGESRDGDGIQFIEEHQTVKPQRRTIESLLSPHPPKAPYDHAQPLELPKDSAAEYHMPPPPEGCTLAAPPSQVEQTTATATLLNLGAATLLEDEEP